MEPWQEGQVKTGMELGLLSSFQLQIPHPGQPELWELRANADLAYSPLGGEASRAHYSYLITVMKEY